MWVKVACNVVSVLEGGQSYSSLSRIVCGSLSSCTSNTSIHSHPWKHLLAAWLLQVEVGGSVSTYCCSCSEWSGICPLVPAQAEGSQVWLVVTHAQWLVLQRNMCNTVLVTFWLLLNKCLLSGSYVLSTCLQQAAEFEDTAHMLQNRIHSDRLDWW